MSENRNKITFPGGSKGKVNRAGDNIRNDTATLDDLKTIEEWRAAHRAVLNTFQAILRTRTKGKAITVAQRHKRRRTIFDKLLRLPGMQLARMDDIAGCRMIFKDITSLRKFRNEFHQARFNHKLRHDIDKYDYLLHPKSTGYRGIHDIYEYNVNSSEGKSLTGLYVEIQYRTKVQHAWATAVEIVGHITESQPKFQKGDQRYHEAMALASEILARAFEKSKGPFPEKTNIEILTRFQALDIELNLIQTLTGLTAADKFITKNNNTILIFGNDGLLTIKTFRDATDAMKELFRLENEQPEKDIVLVRAKTTDEVRFAFKNYFSDANEFVKLISSGINTLRQNEPPRKRFLLRMQNVIAKAKKMDNKMTRRNGSKNSQ